MPEVRDRDGNLVFHGDDDAYAEYLATDPEFKTTPLPETEPAEDGETESSKDADAEPDKDSKTVSKPPVSRGGKTA
jgi:hypothetical protein